MVKEERKIKGMKMEGLSQMIPAAGRKGNGSEAAALQRQIQSLQKDLNRLEQKKELSKEEEQRKKELEKKIAELRLQLQRTRAEDIRDKQKIQGKEEKADRSLKEEGKGGNVDEYI